MNTFIVTFISFPISQFSATFHGWIGNIHRFRSYAPSILVRVPNYFHVYSLTFLRLVVMGKVIILFSSRTAGLIAHISPGVPKEGCCPTSAQSFACPFHLSCSCSSYCFIVCSLSAHFRTLFTPFGEQSVLPITIWSVNSLLPSTFNTTWIMRHCFQWQLGGARLLIRLIPLHAGRKLSFLHPVLLGRVPTAEMLCAIYDI